VRGSSTGTGAWQQTSEADHFLISLSRHHHWGLHLSSTCRILQGARLIIFARKNSVL